MEKLPEIVTRSANSCLTVPLMYTGTSREQDTVPDTVTFPDLSTVPALLALMPSVSGRRTRTTNVPVATFPDRSVAWHVTVVEPTGNTDPDSGVHTTVGLGSRSSEADT